MMKLSPLICAIMAFATLSPAAAQNSWRAPAVSEQVLGQVSGGFDEHTSLLSVRQLKTIGEDDARADFRFLGSIGSVTMDVWWAAAGADLIAEAMSRDQ